jgi:hypothetical protein
MQPSFVLAGLLLLCPPRRATSARPRTAHHLSAGAESRTAVLMSAAAMTIAAPTNTNAASGNTALHNSPATTTEAIRYPRLYRSQQPERRPLQPIRRQGSHRRALGRLRTAYRAVAPPAPSIFACNVWAAVVSFTLWASS